MPPFHPFHPPNNSQKRKASPPDDLIKFSLPAAGSRPPQVEYRSFLRTPVRIQYPSHGTTIVSPESRLTQVNKGGDQEIKYSTLVFHPCIPTRVSHQFPVLSLSTGEVLQSTQTLTLRSDRSDESICQLLPLSSSPHTSTL